MFPPPKGLFNSSTDCFLIVLIQGLYKCRSVRNAINEMSQIIGGTGLIGLLSEIFRHLQKTDSREIRGVTEIRKFLTLKTKRFGGDRHEDPADCFAVISDWLASNEDFDLSQFFRFSSTTANPCSVCEANNICTEKIDVVPVLARPGKTLKQSFYLNESFCKCNRFLTQFRNVVSTSEFLLLNLNQLSDGGEKMSNEIKLETKIRFGEFEYQMIAQIKHIGSSSKFGHYVVTVKDDDEEDIWYLLDDDKTSIVGKEAVGFGSPNLILFERIQNPAADQADPVQAERVQAEDVPAKLGVIVGRPVWTKIYPSFTLYDADHLLRKMTSEQTEAGQLAWDRLLSGSFPDEFVKNLLGESVNDKHVVVHGFPRNVTAFKNLLTEADSSTKKVSVKVVVFLSDRPNAEEDPAILDVLNRSGVVVIRKSSDEVDSLIDSLNNLFLDSDSSNTNGGSNKKGGSNENDIKRRHQNGADEDGESESKKKK